VPARCQDVRVTGTAALDEFQEQRQRLFGIAYRMLGSATDAEDVLQDAWLRWEGVDRPGVADPAAFLARTVTNLCLNALTSARARREVYVGPWLPEPVLTGNAVGGSGPLDDALQRESISFALLALLERLSPAERAAYVLREAFAYSPREVAELIGTTEANARQLHSRARRHVVVPQSREVDAAHWRELITRFLVAARDGDLAGLEALLAADVVSRSDGGGIVSAARRPVLGRENVARFVAGLFRRFEEGPATGVRRRQRRTGDRRPRRGREPARRPGAAHRRRATDRAGLGGEPGEAGLRRTPAVTDRRPARSERVRKGEHP
jgi:RNA polymerase sigma factor (sigma-70 family)